MHAVFVVSELNPGRATEAETMLKTRIAPQIKQAPGFVSATWARSADGKEGRSMIVFETEEAARTTLASVTKGMPSDGPVKIITTSVLEVVLQV